jgi:Penicillin-insensitive murein endopeptidase
MSWRRGEVWLDPELSWFREVPAVVTVAAPVPSFGPPPGLVASRVRRAAWEQRRDARRARATAIAMSPAVMLAIAALRSAGDPASAPPAEDPPSLEFTLGAVPAQALRELHPIPRAVGAAELERAIAARAEARPAIDWHHAVSLGLPYDGSLIDGTQLPTEGPDWVTWNPVTDSSPNARRRLYGNERTIRAIVSVTAAYRVAHPEAPRVVIGDISREGGGPMWDEHVSHQNGLDVDVYLPRLDRKLVAPVAEDQVDHLLAQDLVDRFVAAGAKVIFVGYSTGLHGPPGVVVPYPGHEYHMHVRFPRPGR